MPFTLPGRLDSIPLLPRLPVGEKVSDHRGIIARVPLLGVVVGGVAGMSFHRMIGPGWGSITGPAGVVVPVRCRAAGGAWC